MGFLFFKAHRENGIPFHGWSLSFGFPVILMCLVLLPTPLAPKFLSTLQEVVPHSVGSGKGTWLQKELSLVPAAPDPCILVTAHTFQICQLRGTEANDTALNFNCQERVEEGHCVHSRSLSGGSPLVWETCPEHHGRLVSGSVC